MEPTAVHDLTTLEQVLEPIHVPDRARNLDKAARIGLVLAIVVALAGVVGAVTKSRDDAATTTTVSHTTPKQRADAAYLAAVPDGFSVLQGDGVYVALPQGWRTVSKDELKGVFDDDMLQHVFPELDGSFRKVIQRALSRGAIMVSVDPDPSHAGRNINLIRVKGEAPLDGIAEQIGDEFHSAGIEADVHQSQDITTPLGAGVRMSYSLTVGQITVETVQFYVPADGYTYILTGTSDGGVADAAIQTLRQGTAPTAHPASSKA